VKFQPGEQLDIATSSKDVVKANHVSHSTRQVICNSLKLIANIPLDTLYYRKVVNKHLGEPSLHHSSLITSLYLSHYGFAPEVSTSAVQRSCMRV
jgi:hypothetical protein